MAHVVPEEAAVGFEEASSGGACECDSVLLELLLSKALLHKTPLWDVLRSCNYFWIPSSKEEKGVMNYTLF